MASPNGSIVDEHVRDDENTSGNERPRKMARVGTREEEGPSCSSCRRRKTKCSRDQPCSNCSKIGANCVYDGGKMKPGLRTGAVESLSQRLTTLENMFVGQGIMWQQMLNAISGSSAQPHLSESLPSPPMGSLQEQSSAFKQRLSFLTSGDPVQFQGNSISTSATTKAAALSGIENMDPCLSNTPMPPDELVDSLVEIYFETVHPWIPMLHVRNFRAALASPEQRAGMTTILQAIVSLCIRFSDDPLLNENPSLRTWYATRCRQAVILKSMETFSVRNVQALIICAFDTIGSGHGPSTWSMVGSMARTVEQLRLSKEESDVAESASAGRSLMNRMTFLPPCNGWQEAEERRRVFWNVFLMDRFCSISTGWNPCLTSADFHRRLPCEGAIWEESEHLQIPTPFFGTLDQMQHPEALPELHMEREEEQNSLGGFAYCIEATENLRLVIFFFLQHEVDFGNSRDIQKWLIRFKQLDLRLMQWKALLPETWREACLVNDDGNLDPNLVLAHITHNTAVVLLHQGLAYPSSEWKSIPAKLPSVSSAETCLAATEEVSRITTRFLPTSPVLANPQFAFCLFVCGRALLTHAVFQEKPISPVFDSILQSLDEISKRWNGRHASTSSNLASKFKSRLLQARQDGYHGAASIREEAFSDKKYPNCEPEDSSPSSLAYSHATAFQLALDANATAMAFKPASKSSPDSVSLAFPPLPGSLQDAFLTQPSHAMQQVMDSSTQDTISVADCFTDPSLMADPYPFLDQTIIPSDRVTSLRGFMPQ
ncbi:Zn(2)-C6 fungal-type domain-containing protein [Fusarium sp. LHS14.1]|nr:Zn(2)-C6 fungal-type domain-containing protein [Fusarium sp. LHS14.1]